MPKAKHYSLDGKVLGEVDLPDRAFGIRPNQHVIWESVNAYLANKRQGTAATKTRSEVRGGGKKPWRQKGTGRARAGTNRSPLWRGGSTIFGPQPRDFSKQVPKKTRRLALASALSQRAQEGNVAVVDGFTFDTPKTRTVVDFVKAAGMDGRKLCFITRESQPTAVKSCRNLAGVEVLTQAALNVYDLVNADVLIFTPEAIEGIKETYGS